MLVGNRHCSIAIQHYVQAEKIYMQHKFLDPQNPQMLLTLKGMYNNASKFGFEGVDTTFYNLASEAGRVLGLDDEDVSAHYSILAHYGLALYGSFFAYDYNQEDLSKRMSLYTSSISFLQTLANRGMIIDKKKDIPELLAGLEKKLYGGIIQKNIKDDDTLYAIRLDPVINGHNVQFTLTMPRTPVKLSTHMIIGFDVVKTALDLFDQLLRNNMFRITMGDKVRIVSKNLQVLNTVYNSDGQHADYIDKVLSEGYDTRLLKFYCPVIGASIYTAGVTNIRITEIDKIEQVGIADVDFSNINLNLLGVRLEALEQIKANKKYKQVAKYLNLKLEKGADIEEAVIKQIEGMYDSNVWEMMTALPKVFDTEAFKSKPNRFGSLYEKQSLPISKPNLETLLKGGVYKILMRKRDGSFTTIVTSSNQDIIASILGEDYYGKFESEGVRYRRAIQAVKDGVSIEEAAKLYNTPVALSTDPSDYISMLEVELIDVENRKTVVKQSHLLTVRCLDATSPKSFYRQVDVNSIKELVRLQ